MELIKDLVVKPDPPTDYRTPYLDCLLHEMLPTDKMEARRLTHRAKSFIVIKGELFKRSHTRILSRGRTCWKTSMKGSTDITPHLEP